MQPRSQLRQLLAAVCFSSAFYREVGASDPSLPFCIRITTGASGNADGFLVVKVNGVEHGDGINHALGAVIVNSCYAWEPAEVTLRNPETNGWGGVAEVSDDGGASWVSPVCTGCVAGSGSSVPLVVDGNSDGINQAPEACLGGDWCVSLHAHRRQFCLSASA